MGSFYTMSADDLIVGFVYGHAEAIPTELRFDDPREALEAELLGWLQHSPCGVLFSGGRDSSAVLAVATHVARREGLPDPIPITRVFPEAEGADESEWQELVIRHLGIDEWRRIAIVDETDFLGPIARAGLREHGVLWPPAIHNEVLVLREFRGGSLIDGQGGDEILDVRPHRIAPVSKQLSAQRTLDWPSNRRALGALLPRPMRRRRSQKQAERRHYVWLTDAGARRAAEIMATERADEPLTFAAGVRRMPRRRAWTLMEHNRQRLAKGLEVRRSSPLMARPFVDAVARRGGVLGHGDRTTALRDLVPDLLPDAILTRTSKVYFNTVYFGEHTRRFAERWSGDGVDRNLVQPEVLRGIWLSEWPFAITSGLLQAAWCAEQSKADAVDLT